MNYATQETVDTLAKDLQALKQSVDSIKASKDSVDAKLDAIMAMMGGTKAQSGTADAQPAEKKADEKGFFGKAGQAIWNKKYWIVGGTVLAGAAYWFFGRSNSDEQGGTIDFRKQQLNKMTGISGGNRTAA